MPSRALRWWSYSSVQLARLYGTVQAGSSTGYAGSVTPLLSILLFTAQARTGDLTLVIRGEEVRFVELACRTGHRERQRPRSAGPNAVPEVTFANIPGDECVVHFKGTTPRRYGPLPRSGTLECRLDGRLARCAPLDPPAAAPAPATPPARTVAPSPPVHPAPTSGFGPPAAASGSEALELLLLDAPGVFGFELSCRSGHRARATRPADGRPARFATVPGDDCRVHFRGSPPAIIHTVQPGTRLRCEIRGVTALCAPEPIGD